MAAQGDLSGDRLEIRVKAARGLTKIAGTEPSCIVGIEYGMEKRATEMVSSLTPEWDKSKMYVFSNVAEQDVEYLVFKLVHKDMTTFKDVVIGVLPVELSTVMNSPNITQDGWRQLRSNGDGGPEFPGVELRIQMTYMMDDIELGEDPEFDESQAKHKPNFLSLTLEKGRNLMIEQGRSSVDPEAIITVLGTSKVTTCVRNDTNPRFNWKGGFNINQPDWVVEIAVRDRARFGSPILGRCRVTMTEILAEQPFKHWVKLLDDQYRFGPEGLGEVLLGADFVYNRKARRLIPSMPRFGRSSKQNADKRDQSLVAEAEHDRLLSEAEAAGDNLDATVAMFGEEREIWEKEQAAAQALALKQQKQQAKRMEKVMPGDYQVSIHVIEARDLKPQDSSGTSDPFVTAKCSLGGTSRTATQKSNNSPLFDERLVFSYKDLTRQALHEATITVSVYDEDFYIFKQMIGSCSFDILGIYTKNEQHEIYRSWVGLTDTEENNDEVGIQGFLKLSISVLGPGDPIPVHDLEEELKLERSRERDEPGAEGTMQWARERKLEYIAMSIHKAQELLTTSNVVFSSRVYCRLEFAGNKINSHPCTVNSATFNEQLWVPAYVPTMATRVVISMWKRGGAFATDIPLGHHYIDFAKIKKCKRERELKKDLNKENQWKWVNLYGADIKGVKQKSSSAKLMNTFGEHASTYRGRLLINTRTLLRPPADFNNVPVRKKLPISVTDSLLPKQANYVLRGFLIQGCEIPEFKNILPDLEEGTNIAKMKVKITIGANSIEWDYASNGKGMVVWNALAETKNISLPEDFNQIPDAMIYLIRENDNAPVSFLRVPVVELLAENFQGPPKFYHLRPDRSRKAALGEAEYAGSVSIKLGFGREEVARQHQWSDFSEVDETSAYCLRIHLFQARGLPASDESGTIDPYVKIRFNGLRTKSSQKEKTCDPCWFESLEIDNNSLMLPEDPDFCPEIVLRVWDSDGMFSANSPVCGFHLSLKDVPREVGGTATAPEPKWHECFLCNDTLEKPAPEGNKKGELLVSFQLISKKTRNEIVRPNLEIISETLRPHYKLVWLDILAWGVRDLQGGSNPYVRFDIVGSDGKITSHKSKKSNKPNGRSANFLERIVTSIELPEDIIFTPMLNIRVYDNVYGGVGTDMVGSVSVDLVNKLPWSESYQAPQNEEFETAAKIDKGKQKILDRRAKAKAAGKQMDSDDDDDGGDDDEAVVELNSDDEAEKPIDPSTLDSGLGAFDFTSSKTSSSIWQLPEDVHSLVKKGKGGDNGDDFLGDWWGGKEEEFNGGEDPAVTNDLPDPRELGIDIPDSWASKEWLQDRDFWVQKGGSNLEAYLKTSPFENYILKKGCTKSNGTSTVRVVGKFKGLISISDSKNAEPLVPLERVADYVARLYVWKAESLQPSDPNGKADPYLKIHMGGFSESGRKGHEIATVNPDFYKVYEIPMKIPGESQLKISVYDWDRFHLPGSSDTLIGETIVDVEDRYFHKNWKSLGELSDQKPLTGAPKPIEARDLFIPESSNSQGKVYLWLEVMPAGEARALKPVNFNRPPPMEIEVRVILWALSGYSCDESSQDYFVKTYLKGAPRKKKETDTHWRSKTGSAQWNWRHKHIIEVPLDMPDKGNLVVEVWDRDIISSNDSLGAFTLPLSDWLKKCYIEQVPIKPFELMNNKINGKEDDKNDLALKLAEDLEEEEMGNGEGDDNVELKAKAPPAMSPMHAPTMGGDVYDDDAFDVDEIQEPIGEDDEEDSTEEEDEDDENAALVKKDKKDEKKPKKPENVLDVLRELVGLPVARDDAHWFDLGVMDVESGEYTTNGQLYITVELVPIEQAESSPVGSGRSEPNTAPYLPPPAGRLKIGLDPCSILCALFAEFPGIICCICCCCCAIILLAVMMVGSTYISAFAALGI
mmetsp:Transcript_30125/g.35520  ORF Transcript_30125/g.35520 Transcript_30125/m.35520 type:complete len:1909 (+) Transcript_30125:29-5755(+)